MNGGDKSMNEFLYFYMGGSTIQLENIFIDKFLETMTRVKGRCVSDVSNFKCGHLE